MENERTVYLQTIQSSTIGNSAKSTKRLLEPMNYQVFNIPKSNLLVVPGSRTSEIGQYSVYSV